MAYSAKPDDSPVWAVTGDKTRPALDNDIAIGWPASATAPPRQKFNWILNQLSRGVRYYLQQGLPEWSVTEEYQQYAYVKYLGIVYRSLSAVTGGGNPVANVGVWEKYGLNMSDVTGAISAAQAGYATIGQVTTAVNNALAIFNPSTLPPGSLGILNNGKWKTFLANGSFTIPAGVTQIRVRVVGGGASAGGGQTMGGPGGGYAHGLFTVVPGATYAITIGAGGAGGAAAGGSTSFGALISATGGTANVGSTAGVGGTGTGGDWQASGGLGGATNGGGGAAGSQLGNGGNGGTGNGGGGAVGGVSGRVSTGGQGGGASLFGFTLRDFVPATNSGAAGGVDSEGNLSPLSALGSGTANGTNGSPNRVVRFPFDGFTGGGGTSTTSGGHGGSGAGGGYGTSVGGAGGTGGGGGGAASTNAGNGGYGGGGGGAGGGTGAAGGQGVCVVEW